MAATAVVAACLGGVSARASFIEPDGVCRAKGIIEYHGFGNGVWNIFVHGTGTCVTQRDGVATIEFFFSDNLHAKKCPDLQNRMRLLGTLYFNGSSAAQEYWTFLVTPGSAKGLPLSAFRAHDPYGDEVGDGLVTSKFFSACLPNKNMPTNVYTSFPATFAFTTVY